MSPIRAPCGGVKMIDRVRSFVMSAAIVVAISLFSAPADAAIDFSWSFDGPLPVIGGQSSTLDIHATIVVGAGSDSFRIIQGAFGFGSFEPEHFLDSQPFIDTLGTYH